MFADENVNLEHIHVSEKSQYFLKVHRPNVRHSSKLFILQFVAAI